MNMTGRLVGKRVDGVMGIVVNGKEGRPARRRKAVTRIGCDTGYGFVGGGHGWLATKGELELAGRGSGQVVDGRSAREDIVAVRGVPVAGRGRYGLGRGGLLSCGGVSLVEETSKERHGGASERATMGPV